MRLRKNNSVCFDEMTHSYICGDKLLSGVTSILHKHGIGPDLSGIPQRVLNAAAGFGTMVHELIEAYEEGRPYTYMQELDAYKALGLSVHCCEYLVSDNETVASMIDLVLEDCSLADIKTWSSIDKDRLVYVAWQLSIYAYLFELMNPSKKVPHLYIIHVRGNEAEKIEVDRVPDEEIKELILAEKEGRIYTREEHLPSVSEALPEEDALTLVQTLDVIAQYKAALKAEEERAAAIQERLYQYMVDNNLDEMGCSTGKFIRKAEYTRSSIDSTKLKKEMPEVYDKYQKVTTVKGSVTFKAN